MVESEGLTYINGYDDPPIMAGAGTMGIEMIDDVPCVDAVVVPVGGGGKMQNKYSPSYLNNEHFLQR
jgi:threonine dehydratase